MKLAAVNWYGAEEKDFVVAGLDKVALPALATWIRGAGFNAVRLPYSSEMVESNPPIADAMLTANPALKGKTALEVYDAVVAALGSAGVMVILDNHTSHADWCCSGTDGDGLWYTADYPESAWLADWAALATRYAANKAVIGADLRNEPRDAAGKSPAWGGADPSVDWHAAAQRGGNAVLAANPDLLVFVEGIDYSLDLSGAGALPIVFAVPDRLVYEPHDYAFDHPGLPDAATLNTALGNKWGYLLTQNQPFTAPVWVGEFGTCHGNASCVYDSTGQGLWYHALSEYLLNADIDWAYWAVNGTQARGTGRVFGAEETYGVLDTTWTHAALAQHLASLRSLQPATQGP